MSLNKLFERFFFLGIIPFRGYFQRFFLVLASLTPLIWYFPENWRMFGDIGWMLLIFILAIRPVSAVFPKIGLLRSLVPFRKETGILCAALALSHGAGFYISNQFPIVSSFFDFTFWTFNDNQGYAHLAGLTAIVLLITSNRWSQILLKRNWKKLQKLAYVFFLTAGLHVALIGDDMAETFIQMGFVVGFWFLAHYKIVLWKR
jgi:DMSO/TMAO reductase YedYZ heme-binding membrane subunit